MADAPLPARRDTGRTPAGAGASGGDGCERTGPPPAASGRAGRHPGCRYPGKDTVTAGDTLRDAAAAKTAGTRVTAAATGTVSPDEPAAAGADTASGDLTGTSAVRDAIPGSR